MGPGRFRRSASATIAAGLCLGFLLAGTPAWAGEEPAGRLAGVVAGPDGKPVAGAEVRLWPEDGRPDVPGRTRASLRAWFEAPPAPVAVGRSDAAGRFRLGGLSPGERYGLEVRAPPSRGLAARRVRAVALGEGAPALHVALRRGHLLRLRLVDAEGNGRAGTVDAYPGFATRHWHRRTWPYDYVQGRASDRTGRADLVVPRVGTLYVRARVPGLGARTFLLDAADLDGDAIRDLPLRLARGVLAHGRVLDGQGRPIAGARVALAVQQGRLHLWQASCVAVTRSGADGSWYLAGLPEGRLTNVAASAPGRVVLHAMLGGAPLQRGRPWTCDLPLGRAGRLEGRVLDEAGRPLAGVTVGALPTVLSGTAGLGPSARTDGDGRFAFDELPDAPGGLTLDAPLHALRVAPDAPRPSGVLSVRYAPPTPSAPRSVTVHAVRGAVLRGRVRTAAGVAVPWARVVVTATAPAAPRQVPPRLAVRRGASDARGDFALDGVPAGAALRVRVESAGRVAVETAVAPLAPGSAPLTVVLPAEVELRGHVFDAAGAPLPGVSVRVGGTSLRWGYPGPDACTTAADGSFVLHTAARGEVALSAGDVRAVVSVPASGGVEGIVLHGPEGRRVAGRVVDEDGEPVPHVSVSVRVDDGGSDSCLADRTGRFELEGVPPGPCHLRAEGSASLDVAADARSTDLEVVARLPRDRVLEGRVLDPEGHAVPRASVRLAYPQDGPRAGRGSGAVLGGGFRVRLPDDHHPRWAVHVDGARDARGEPLAVLPGRAEFDVHGGKPLVIRLQAALTVEGRVLDDEGGALDGLRLMLQVAPGAGGTTRPPLWTWTHDGGRFRFAGVPPGPARLALPYLQGFVPASLPPVQGGAQDVVLTLQRWRHVSGRVLDPDGKPAAGAVVLLYVSGSRTPGSSSAVAGPDGSFAFRNVRPGPAYVLRATPPRRETPVEVPVRREGVRAGAHDVVLQLGRGLAIEGTVTDGEGHPLSGFQVRTTKVRREDGRRLLDASARATLSDEHGRWRLAAFEKGAIADLSVQPPADQKGTWFGTSRKAVAAGTTGLAMEVEHAETLRVRCEGPPVAVLRGLTVSVVQSLGRRGSRRVAHGTLDGTHAELTLGPLHAGSYRIVCTHRRHRSFFLPGPVDVKLPAGGPVVLKLPPATTLTGRLAVADPAGFVLEFHQEGGRVMRVRSFGRDGFFAAGPLRDAPGTLWLSKPGDPRVLWREGVRPGAGVLLLDPVQGKPARGRVVDLAGKLERPRLTLVHGPVRVSGKVAEDGWWETPALPPGVAWNLEMRCRRPRGGHFVPPGPVHAGDRDVFVRWKR